MLGFDWINSVARYEGKKRSSAHARWFIVWCRTSKSVHTHTHTWLCIDYSACVQLIAAVLSIRTSHTMNKQMQIIVETYVFF